MKLERDGIRRLTKLRDTDGVVLPGVPLVEISGDRRVLIEHHLGVVGYGCQEIRVRVKYGTLSVKGTGLNLARMTKEQLVICGCINSVCINKTGGAG